MEDSFTELERGRAAFSDLAWAEAYRALSAAGRERELDPADLEMLATSAYMEGHEAEYLELQERAHDAWLKADDALAAVRCAFWIGVNLARQGEVGRAGGWLARGQRLLEDEPGDFAERGYLLMPRAFEFEARGELDRAAVVAGEAAAIARRFNDPDLFALATHTQGHLLIRDGHLKEGLGLLDEAMVELTREGLSPIVSGIVYCGVILACREAHEVRRAGEWTEALSGWCERQPEMVAFTGRCLVHRAEIKQLHGEWAEGLDEARRARERCLAGENPAAAGEACYRLGEIHRLQGDFKESEQAYREASRRGREPQPGLALLRLAQGMPADGVAAMRRALAETARPARRLALLPAAIEIMLAAGERETARELCLELERITGSDPPSMLEAILTTATGAIELDSGRAVEALPALRRSWELWQELDAPYESSRVRILVGAACHALGDEEAASLEMDAARETLEGLGAGSEFDRLIRLAQSPEDADGHGLTRREIEVLRLVAAGSKNREIAEELVISEHTVARHVQNIFAKLGVSSRTAAARLAVDRGLI